MTGAFVLDTYGAFQLEDTGARRLFTEPTVTTQVGMLFINETAPQYGNPLQPPEHPDNMAGLANWQADLSNYTHLAIQLEDRGLWASTALMVGHVELTPLSGLWVPIMPPNTSAPQRVFIRRLPFHANYEELLSITGTPGPHNRHWWIDVTDSMGVEALEPGRSWFRFYLNNQGLTLEERFRGADQYEEQWLRWAVEFLEWRLDNP
jgi:hypothetical protein